MSEKPASPQTISTLSFNLSEAVSREEAPLRFVRELFSAIQTQRLRGGADERARRKICDLEQALLAVAMPGERLKLYRSGPHLFLGQTRIRPTAEVRIQVRSLWVELERLGLGGFEFEPTLGTERLEAFLELLPNLPTVLANSGELVELSPAGVEDRSPARRVLGAPLALVPGVRALPWVRDAEADLSTSDRRAQARLAFFRALAAASTVTRQFAHRRIPELRKARAVVHGMVDMLVEQEFSLLGLSAIQSFDAYTFQHSVHVSVLSMALGQRLGLPRSDLAALGVAAMFHDVGKTRVPKEVVHKPARYDDQDWSFMRRHPLYGAQELLRYGGVSDLAIQVMLVSVEHHLRFDGSGYPSLGTGWQQGLFARIVTLTDCFDAMTASRVYMKRPFTPDAVVRYMFENSGRMFDPDLLRLFAEVVGLYPVGSMVRLESGELAVVVEPPGSPREVDRPSVRLLVSTESGWTAGAARQLAAGPSVDPRYRIQAGCHPQDHGVDVDGLLAGFYLETA